ncbi:MAG: glycerol-3-phosphate ABC transporter permease [Anaerolineaceae bacterium]|nr:glycerol-3-phosphate ABC transporter permease [Anaerolineaceae bacterium]
MASVQRIASGRQDTEKRRVSTHVLVVIFAILIGFPFLFMVSTSLKSFEEVFVVPMKLFPSELRWDNYTRVWEIVPFAQFTMNSLIYTLSITIGEFVIGAASGFAFARLNFPGKRFLFFLVLISFMIPGEITLVPRFILLSKLQWINTYPGLIVPELSSAFTTFMLAEHFRSLSDEIFEAARVDGAGFFRQLWQIAIPISKPIVSTLLLLAFVAHWNAYLWPLVVTNSESMRTLPIGIQQIRSGLTLPEWQLVMAGTTIVVIPLIILFILAQKQFIEGATQGALKG